MESLNEMWNLVCEVLKQDLSEVIFNIWFAPIKINSFDGKRVVLEVSEFKKNIIEKQFGDELSSAFRTVTGLDVEIIMVDPDRELTFDKKENNDNFYGSENNTFETFVVGPSNRFAYTAAQAVSETPVVKYNPLFIYGSSGLGKTHLLCAIKNAVLKKNADANVIFTTGEDFVNYIMDGLKNKNMDTVREKFRNCDILLVDDIQFIAGKESTQEEFFHTFNSLTADGKQIVLTSDSTPKEMTVLDARLRSRFEQGLMADISTPDLDTRMAIIQQKAAELDMEIPGDVVEYIAEKVKTNIRQLEGAVKKIHALINLEGSPITIALAQNAIRDIASEGLPVNELVGKIISETARAFGIPNSDIVSKKKDAKTAKARQIAIFAIRECTDLTQQEISEFFGGRDRTAIHYALNKTLPMIDRDASLRKTVENIIKNAKEQ
ncbi:MAG: chromosomal replication initiator protein DnaA [Clostridia bacterium]|nr:chromosomal replication initiator protein DnaA [Clostridia bacterium]